MPALRLPRINVVTTRSSNERATPKTPIATVSKTAVVFKK
jgi:hypothetical protein